MLLRSVITACILALLLASCSDLTPPPEEDLPKTAPVNLETFEWGSYLALAATSSSQTITLGDLATFAFSGVTGATDWAWFVDGVRQPESSATFSYTPALIGTSTIDVTVVRNGTLYSGSFTLIVEGF